ncbi:MAG: effector binding domain-containing protein [Defluviitaleaceae bacterium]|nr:effector binding domain-containing protein [Defluviitaleaceae bacterium]
MNLQTVSTVSKVYGVSTRMLRYYEQNGLIQSQRKAGYSYRVYDEANLRRLQQVVILRKLQIPVKQICIILNNPDAATVVEIFERSIQELDSEITALSTIKRILERFANEIQEAASLDLNLGFLKGDDLLELTGSLTLIQKNIRGNRDASMKELFEAADILNKLENVRVIYVPPMTVASVYYTGEDAEESAWQALTSFVKESNLLEMKPDLRVFKIAHQNATGHSFGDEAWVSIPDALDIPEGFVKKRFLGGQYAAHVLDNNGFEVALGLQDWVNESDKYQYDYDENLMRCDPPIKEIDSFGGMHLDLSEVLNFNNFQKPGFEMQIDFLTPIKDYIIVEDEAALEEIPDSLEKCGYKVSIVTKNKFRIMGFTKIISGEASVDGFIEEVRNDGRLDILNKYRKPDAPVLGFGSMDLDSQIRGGWRYTICLAESDITDVDAFMQHNLYIKKIDASRWLIFEYAKGDDFDGHVVCPKLGYTWNGIISGSFTATPNGRLWNPDPMDEGDVGRIVYEWYPVK